MKIKMKLVTAGVILFLIDRSLDFMFNLLSADRSMVEWYNKNHALILVLAGLLVLMGIILTIVSVIKDKKEDENFLREQMARHQDNRRKLLTQKSN
ncbi:hypothetical protein L0337_12805 [candidate division KSB1 bacterium]|nr:hypothetical protein [candidate division KSB1 bacterium]